MNKTSWTYLRQAIVSSDPLSTAPGLEGKFRVYGLFVAGVRWITACISRSLGFRFVRPCTYLWLVGNGGMVVLRLMVKILRYP